MSGGRNSKRGTPQGGVVSPLLSVIYINRFLKHWRLSGSGAHVVSYADDFVILSRGHAEEALAWTKAVMTKLGLALNEAKTSVKNAREESFDFLGYTLGPRHFPEGGRWYLGASLSKKSVRRIKTKVSELLTPENKGAWPEVQARLNRLLGGWSAYFSHGALASVYRAVDDHVYDHVRNSCADDTKRRGAAQRGFLVRTSTRNWACCAFVAGAKGPDVCLTMKPVGKPDAGNPHVRFDERGGETERRRMAQATAPVLDFTSKTKPTCDHDRFPIARQGFRPCWRIMAPRTRPEFALSSIWKPEAMRF